VRRSIERRQKENHVLKRILTVCATLVVLSTAGVEAQAPASIHGHISIPTLEHYGVNARTFSLALLSPDNRQVIATDDPPFIQKRKGIIRRIWVFDLESDLKVRQARHIDLALPEIDQLVYTPDGHSLLLITRRGAELYRIDLASGQQTRLAGHTKGNSGVRLDPPIMSSYNGKIYCHGFSYDGNDVGSPIQMFEVDPSGSGASVFTPVWDLGKVERGVQGGTAEISLCPKGAFFAHRDAGGQSLERWTPSGGMQNVDQGLRLTGVWGEGTHLLYTMAKSGGINELVLADAITGDRKVLASGTQSYYNPVLAKQATSLLVATVDRQKHDMSAYIAQDVDNYALHPLLLRIPLSVFRVSPDGQLLAVYNKAQGIMLTKLP
jgi:hypothetical protein